MCGSSHAQLHTFFGCTHVLTFYAGVCCAGSGGASVMEHLPDGSSLAFDPSTGATINAQQQPDGQKGPQANRTPAPAAATPAPVSRWTTIDEEEEKQSAPQMESNEWHEQEEQPAPQAPCLDGWQCMNKAISLRHKCPVYWAYSGLSHGGDDDDDDNEFNDNHHDVEMISSLLRLAGSSVHLLCSSYPPMGPEQKGETSTLSANCYMRLPISKWLEQEAEAEQQRKRAEEMAAAAAQAAAEAAEAAKIFSDTEDEEVRCLRGGDVTHERLREGGC
eukprot:1140620-Pelagomonas_calceolata.AAC.8